MKKSVFILLAGLYSFFASAQQSIELRPGQMTFKGQGAEQDDRFTSDATGKAGFKTKQELIVIRNSFSTGGAQSFASGTATKMDFDILHHEKKNNTGSNFSLTDDTMLVEESGIYVFDIEMNWTSTFVGDVVLRVLTTTNNSLEYFWVRRTADDTNYQRLMGLVRLTAGERIYLELTQKNSGGAAKNATFFWSIGKL
ncbi:MAG: hypothetical protein U0X91_11235 [Spirosomataceae bacterium]